MPERTLHDTFERIVCINLDHCSERWDRFRQGIKKIGTSITQVSRYSAIDGKRLRPPNWWKAGRGEWGRHQSHTRVLEDALNDKIESILILEDDACFPKDFEQGLCSFLNELPSNWDAVLLGGCHISPPVRFSPNVVQITVAHRTHAYALQKHLIQDAYQFLCDYPDHACRQAHHLDYRMERIHKSTAYNIYAPIQWLVGQGAGLSIIRGHDFSERYWNWPSSPELASLRVVNQIPQGKRIAVAVLGLSQNHLDCVAGILHSLGLYVESQFDHVDGSKCRSLHSNLEHIWSDTQLTGVVSRTERVRILRKWLKAQAKQAATQQSIAVACPLLRLIGVEMLEAWGGSTKFISLDDTNNLANNMETIADSSGQLTEQRVAGETLGAKELFLTVRNHLSLSYEKIAESPETTIRQIADFLNIRTNPDQLASAIESVRKIIDPAQTQAMKTNIPTVQSV
jgi:hypothetical protein